MRKHRWHDRNNWREWLWSALLGVGLALLCILWLNGRRAPATPAPEAEQTEERSLGFEFTLRFRILLPKGREG